MTSYNSDPKGIRRYPMNDENPYGCSQDQVVIEADNLRALAGILTPDDLKAIARKAVEDAKNGSASAREWVGRYLLRVPAPKPKPKLKVPPSSTQPPEAP